MELRAQEARPTLGGRIGIALLACGGLLFLGAGSLLWWRHGDAVFASMVQAAIAWCF